MLTSLNTRSIPMATTDAYIISKIIGCVCPTLDCYVYSNASSILRNHLLTWLCLYREVKGDMLAYPSDSSYSP
jgi:hypothetical protein